MELITFTCAWLATGIAAWKAPTARWIWLVLAGVLAILFAYVPLMTTPIDTAVYMKYFNNPYLYAPTFEKGYVLFQNILASTGMSYWTYRLVLVGVGFASYFFMLTRFQLPQNLFWFFYPMVPFIEETMQLRNFLMLACMAVAAGLLAPKRHLWGSFFFILLGISMQSTGVFYLPAFAIYLCWQQKKWRQRIFYLCVVLYVLMLIPFLRQQIAAFLGSLDLSALLGSLASKISNYLARGTLNRIAYVDFAYAVGNLFFCLKLTQLLQKKHLLLDHHSQEVARICGAFIATGIFILPFLPLAYNFGRVVKNSFIFLFAFAVLVLYELRSIKDPLVPKLTLAACIYFGGYFVAFYLLSASKRIPLELIPIFTQNTLFHP
ncbi:EpsG family protein [Lactobacillus sp. DCY120]|uniref:EpsG family protein n=1 Tax=Bombilactobacillus apium TaxID=2675299 RepID=A0A850R244_9LACO|nr:EpsG family protein [Bombilactobacillus apium]NVY96091.1 EpsG family protein [Bombilactobacillus apium]